MPRYSYFLPFALTALAQTPQPLLDSSGHVRDESYIPSRSPDSARAYADIDGVRMKALVEEIVAISLKSRDDGNRY